MRNFLENFFVKMYEKIGFICLFQNLLERSLHCFRNYFGCFSGYFLVNNQRWQDFFSIRLRRFQDEKKLKKCLKNFRFFFSSKIQKKNVKKSCPPQGKDEGLRPSSFPWGGQDFSWGGQLPSLPPPKWRHCVAPKLNFSLQFL